MKRQFLKNEYKTFNLRTFGINIISIICKQLPYDKIDYLKNTANNEMSLCSLLKN